MQTSQERISEIKEFYRFDKSRRGEPVRFLLDEISKQLDWIARAVQEIEFLATGKGSHAIKTTSLLNEPVARQANQVGRSKLLSPRRPA